jgi:hypothetical protein
MGAKIKIKKITIEVECRASKCKKTFKFTTDEIKSSRHTCDCDYPCGCKSNPYKYVEFECPHCGQEDSAIISEEE